MTIDNPALIKLKNGSTLMIDRERAEVYIDGQYVHFSINLYRIILAILATHLELKTITIAGIVETAGIVSEGAVRVGLSAIRKKLGQTAIISLYGSYSFGTHSFYLLRDTERKGKRKGNKS